MASRTPTPQELIDAIMASVNVPPVGQPMGIPMNMPGLPAGFPAGFPAGLPAGFPAGLPAGFPAHLPQMPVANMQFPAIPGAPHPAGDDAQQQLQAYLKSLVEAFLLNMLAGANQFNHWIGDISLSMQATRISAEDVQQQARAMLRTALAFQRAHNAGFNGQPGLARDMTLTNVKAEISSPPGFNYQPLAAPNMAFTNVKREISPPGANYQALAAPNVAFGNVKREISPRGANYQPRLAPNMAMTHVNREIRPRGANYQPLAAPNMEFTNVNREIRLPGANYQALAAPNMEFTNVNREISPPGVNYRPQVAPNMAMTNVNREISRPGATYQPRFAPNMALADQRASNDSAGVQLVPDISNGGAYGVNVQSDLVGNQASLANQMVPHSGTVGLNSPPTTNGRGANAYGVNVQSTLMGNQAASLANQMAPRGGINRPQGYNRSGAAAREGPGQSGAQRSAFKPYQRPITAAPEREVAQVNNAAPEREVAQVNNATNNVMSTPARTPSPRTPSPPAIPPPSASSSRRPALLRKRLTPAQYLPIYQQMLPYCEKYGRPGMTVEILELILKKLKSMENRHLVEWMDTNGGFRITGSNRLALEWGRQKRSMCKSYSTMARYLRHEYKNGLISKLPESFCYRVNLTHIPCGRPIEQRSLMPSQNSQHRPGPGY